MVNSLINPHGWKHKKIVKNIPEKISILSVSTRVLAFIRDRGKNFDNWYSVVQNSWRDRYQDSPAQMSIIRPLFLLFSTLADLYGLPGVLGIIDLQFRKHTMDMTAIVGLTCFHICLVCAVLNQEWDGRGSANNLINCFLWELIQPKFRSGPWSCYNNNSEAGIIWEERLWNTDSNGFMSRHLWWDQSVAGKTLKSYLYVRNTLHYSGINQK